MIRLLIKLPGLGDETGSSQANTQRFRPQLESLDGRALPSAGLATVVDPGVVVLSGGLERNGYALGGIGGEGGAGGGVIGNGVGDGASPDVGDANGSYGLMLSWPSGEELPSLKGGLKRGIGGNSVGDVSEPANELLQETPQGYPWGPKSGEELPQVSALSIDLNPSRNVGEEIPSIPPDSNGDLL